MNEAEATPDRRAKLRQARRYRRVLHQLLKRDYLRRADWEYALGDLARMAKAAVEAHEALVAVFVQASGTWSAVASTGERLTDEEISVRGSRAILERVLQTGESVLMTSEAPLDLVSPSLAEHEIHTVVCIPLSFWDVTQPKPQPGLGGCLYVHRSVPAPSFTEADVELLTDIAEVAQRTLNILRYLHDVEQSLQSSQLQLQELRRSAAAQFRLGRFETRDPWFAEHVLGPLSRVATADKVCLLILGPTGSGKSHLAQAYHYESARRDGPFVVLDCAQVTSEQTLAAELFGYAPRSGFANAPERGRLGAAALAHRGTLFIDEITTLPPALQQRLLALLQNGTFSPLGTSEKQQVDLQVIAATNEDLDALVRGGRFREDLFWRLSEITVCLPPLNRRPADILPLARGVLNEARERFGREALQGFTERAETALVAHDWSRAGNLRGLEHTVRRSVLLAAPTLVWLDAEDLRFQPTFGAATAEPAPAPESLPVPAPGPEGSLRAVLERKIAEHRGKISAMAVDPEVAGALGYVSRAMPHSTLQVRLRELGLQARVDAARKQQRQALGREAPGLEVLRAAICEHRSGSAAAKALGISRDVLVWQLRKEGLSIRGLLNG
jgi:transcriptional regulator with GAF, ATPase, and Fis domain